MSRTHHHVQVRTEDKVYDSEFPTNGYFPKVMMTNETVTQWKDC